MVNNEIHATASDNKCGVTVTIKREELSPYITTVFWSAVALINIGQSIARRPHENETPPTYQVGRFEALAALGFQLQILHEIVQAHQSDPELKLLCDHQKKMVGQIFLAASRCVEKALNILQHGEVQNRIDEIRASPLGQLNLREIATLLGVTE